MVHDHATALKRKIQGSAGPHFGESCLECHTLGYDKSNTVVNGGFSDLEKAANWKYPATNVAGNWSALESIQNPIDLADVAGIRCKLPRSDGETVSRQPCTAPAQPTRQPASVGRKRSAQAATRNTPRTTSRRSGRSRMASMVATPIALSRSTKAAAAATTALGATPHRDTPAL